MAYTVTPVFVDQPSGGGPFDCVCVFDDGAGKAFKEHITGLNLAEVRQKAQARAATLAVGGPADFKAIAAVLNQPFDFSPASAADPTPRELFAQDVRLLRAMATAAALGAIATDDAGLEAQRQKVSDALGKNQEWIDLS